MSMKEPFTRGCGPLMYRPGRNQPDSRRVT